MKSAVCLLAPAADGRYWAVSRRNDTTQWGLPGGKVDPGESSLEAVLRETFEEVGLKLEDKARLIPLYSAACPGKGKDDTYWVTTYLWPDLVSSAGFVPEEGLAVQSLCERALTELRTCPFARYNHGVFQALRTYREGL